MHHEVFKPHNQENKMKAFKMITVLFTVSTLTSVAFAQEKEQGDGKTLSMVNTAIEKCPQQFSSALEEGRLLNIESSSIKNAQGKWITTTKVSVGSYGQPFMGMPSRVAATLSVIETPNDIQPADGYVTTAECKLEKF